MARDKRKFFGSICVRFDTRRLKIELAPAEDYGGPKGSFRARLTRRWRDSEDGKPLFFDRARLASFVADIGLSALPKPAPAPQIPCGSRVSVEQDGDRLNEMGYTASPVIQDSHGCFVVAVQMYGGTRFVDADRLTVVNARR